MDFYQQTGPMAIGSRLRRLSEKVTENAARIYRFYGVELEPKWFPVFYVLCPDKCLSITEIARRIDHSHPSVSQIVKEMNKKGLTTGSRDKNDGRVHLVRLTEKGRGLAPQLDKQCRDVAAAVNELLDKAAHNLWLALDEFEYRLAGRDLYDRVLEKYKDRERKAVEILDYEPAYHQDFIRLSLEWIEKHFKVESADLVQLENPDKHILLNGGFIKVARLDGEIVGVAALVKNSDEKYELAKMAVTEKVRGKKIGWLLGQAIIDQARGLGLDRLYLESNTKLTPAINLYHKLGFKKYVGPPSPYHRCNIQMILALDENPDADNRGDH